MTYTRSWQYTNNELRLSFSGIAGLRECFTQRQLNARDIGIGVHEWRTAIADSHLMLVKLDRERTPESTAALQSSLTKASRDGILMPR